MDDWADLQENQKDKSPKVRSAVGKAIARQVERNPKRLRLCMLEDSLEKRLDCAVVMAEVAPSSMKGLNTLLEGLHCNEEEIGEKAAHALKHYEHRAEIVIPELLAEIGRERGDIAPQALKSLVHIAPDDPRTRKAVRDGLDADSWRLRLKAEDLQAKFDRKAASQPAT